MSKRKCLAVACSLALVLAVLAGCEQDEIRRYQVPREESPKPHASSRKPQAERMLAAIVPRDDQTWFIKLAGPKQVLEQHKEAFDHFVRSINFEGDGKIAWTVPEGWRQQPSAAMRYATFNLGAEDNPLELTVTPLATQGDAASVLKNVNRWRVEQLGLEPVNEAELGQVTTGLELEGATATLVDFTGRGSAGVSAAAGAPRVSRGPSSGASAVTGRSPFGYSVPEGWAEQAEPGPMSVLTFLVGVGTSQAKITVSPLAGRAGGLLDNVNRWRVQQLGLDPTTDAELGKELQSIEVAGAKAHYVDLTGPSADGKPARRILGVIAARGQQTWFFKMIGPSGLVGEQKPAFEAFVRSIKFE